MDLSYLSRGLIIGFAIAATVGPISLLCIQRTLVHGGVVGFVSGMGAGTADAFYGAVAGLGLTAISDLLLAEQRWLRLGGGLFLCWLGIKTALTPPAARAASAAGVGLAGAYGSTLALTLTNPLTILSFTAIFAGLGAAESEGNLATAALLVVGVFIGSAAWWLILSSGVSRARRLVTPAALRWINRCSGAGIALLGVVALLSLR